MTRIFNGVWVTDVPTGYRMYHASILPFITISSDWFSYQNEIISAIKKHHLRFIEIPVHIKYTEYSLSKGQSNMSALKILKELIYKTFFFRLYVTMSGTKKCWVFLVLVLSMLVTLPTFSQYQQQGFTTYAETGGTIAFSCTTQCFILL